MNGKELVALAARLTAEGAVPRFLASGLGRVMAADGEAIEVDTSFEATPSVLYDGFVLPDGSAAVKALAADGRVLEFLKDQYRHCKPIMVLGASSALLGKAGIPVTLPSGDADPGLLIMKPGAGNKAGEAFRNALAAHRHFARETDPPRV